MRLQKFWPQIILITLAILIAGLNYRPGTFLTGWDNLHPEFNLGLNIQRSIFSLWQEYQGLGLLAGMGHAADLPRQLFLLVLSPLISQNFLRYLSTFLMLIIGPLGVFYLVRKLIKNQTEIIPLCGGLFYLLNLATVQVFYVPFETFVFHYGFLPWLYYLAVSYLKSPQRKTLIYFFLVSFISTTQFYVPTLFVVYLLGLLALGIGRSLKQVLILLVITFIANAFWLLPYSYFTLKSGYIVGQAQENFMATEDVFLKNQEFGDLKNVALLKGLWFNFVDMDQNRQFSYMIGIWRDHLNLDLVKLIGYSLFGVIVIGLISQFRRKNPFRIGLIFLFLIPFAMLCNNTFPFRDLVELLTKVVPLFGQVFRTPFTKFAILGALSYSLLFSFGTLIIVEYFKITGRKLYLLGLACLVGLVYYLLPVFSGNLIYNFERINIPQSYFQTMEFFQSQNPNTRIANLPQQTYWGWNHYAWGNRGSGFLWYGIPQPILDRAFDGFSAYNENYYWEISTAIYSNNQELFNKILNKYQVNWLLIDKNIISSGSSKQLYLDKLEKLVSDTEKYTLAKQFENIFIYEVKLANPLQNFVYTLNNPVNIGPVALWNNYDQAYLDNGDYISSLNANIYYPFRSLFTGRRQEELEFKVTDNQDYFIFKAKIPAELSGARLEIPQLVDEELSQLAVSDLVAVYLDGQKVPQEAFGKSIEVNISQGDLEIVVPKIEGLFSYDSQKDNDLGTIIPQNCNKFNKGVLKSNQIVRFGGTKLKLTSIGSNNCLDIGLPDLSHRLGYLIKVNSKNIEGKSLLFSLVNSGSVRNDIETYLPKNSEITTSYFITPPMEQYQLGYTLHFDNISIGKVRTINELSGITVNPIPYRFLTALKIVKDQGQTSTADFTNLIEKVEHPNPSVYKIRIKNYESRSKDILVLSQSFDNGWKAYRIKKQESRSKDILTNIFPFIFGEELKEHVLVNNWANGWKLNSEQSSELIIIYLPQYLEYLGFVLLIGGFIWLLKPNKPHREYQYPKKER